jgi:hypothetical protein
MRYDAEKESVEMLQPDDLTLKVWMDLTHEEQHNLLMAHAVSLKTPPPGVDYRKVFRYYRRLAIQYAKSTWFYVSYVPKQLVWTMFYTALSSFDEGGILVKAIAAMERAYVFGREALDTTLGKMVKTIGPDLICLGVHMGTSTNAGKLFSVVEFVVRQLGNTQFTYTISEIWTKYISPWLSYLRFGNNARKSEEPSADAFGEIGANQFIEAAVGSATVVGALVAGKKSINNKEISESVTRWGNLGRNVSNMERGISTLSKLATFFTDVVKSAVLYFFPGLTLGLGVEAEFLREGIDVARFMRLHEELTKRDERDALVTNPTTFAKIVEATRLSGLIVRAMAEKRVVVVAGAATSLHNMRREISEFAKYYCHFNSSAIRRCPFHVQIVGAAGVGKSDIMGRLLSDAPKLIVALDLPGTKTGVPEGEVGFTFHGTGEPKIYSKGGGLKHDDKYNTELKCMAWDDMFAGTGETCEESDALWLIRGKSSMTCPVKMAALEDKGAELSILFLVSSTNTEYPQFAEVRHAEAVHRRRDILVRLLKDGSFERLPPKATGSATLEKTYANYDELLVDVVKEGARFLNQPLLGSRVKSSAEIKSFLEKCKNHNMEISDYSREVAAVLSTRADAGEEGRARSIFEELPLPEAPPRVVYNVDEAEGAERDQERLIDEGKVLPWDVCECCASNICAVDRLLRCQYFEDPIGFDYLEDALHETDSWICAQREVWYLYEQEVIWSFMMLKWEEFSDAQQKIVAWFYQEGEASKGLREFLYDIIDYAPIEIRRDILARENIAEVWNWSVQHRYENFYAFFDESLRMQADSGESTYKWQEFEGEGQDTCGPYGILHEMEESRWEKFVAAIHAVWQFTKEKTSAGLLKAKAACSWLGAETYELLYAMGVLTLSLMVSFLCCIMAISLACRAYNGIAHLLGWTPMADAQMGPSGGDAQTSRAGRVKVARFRAHAYEEAREIFKKTLNERGFPEVALAMEEAMEKKYGKMYSDAGYETNSEMFLEKSLFEIVAPFDKGTLFLQGLGIVGSTGLVPWHYAARFKTEKDCTLIYRGMEFPIKVNPSDFTRLQMPDGGDHPDLAFMNLSKKLGQFPDLMARHHLVSLEKIPDLSGTTAEIPSYYRTSRTNGNTIHHVKVKMEKDLAYGDSSLFTDKEDRYVLPTGFTYAVDANKIKCGAPLVHTTTTQGSIFAMHVAKDGTGKSYATIVDHDLIQWNLKRPQLQANAQFDDIPEWMEGNMLGVPNSELSFVDPAQVNLTVYPEGNMQYVATLKPGWQEKISNRTDILPSAFHGEIFPVLSGPSVKTVHDSRLKPEIASNPEFTPLNEGAKKFSRPTKAFPKLCAQRAVRFLISLILLIKPIGMKARKLTESETINGVPSWGYTRLNMLTSAGAPLKRLRNRVSGAVGKRFLFKLQNPTEGDESKIVYAIENEHLRRGVDEYETNLANRVRTFMVTYANLKDEGRSLAKVESGATRLFDCMWLPHTMMIRKYFGSYVAAMNRNCSEGMFAVGIDPASPGWSQLFKRLSKHGGKSICGDYKEWDGRCDPESMMRAVDVVNAWYQTYGEGDWTAHDDIVRQILILDVISTYTIYGNTVVLKNQGLPSGMAVTADFNCLVNALYMYTAFYALRPNDGQIYDPAEMELTFYGDDHVICPEERILKWFNFNTLQQYYADHGIVYTDALKTGLESPDYLPLADVSSYLKRRFVRHPLYPKYILAPLEKKTITELVNWVRKSPDNVAALMSNLRDVQRFSYHHGKEFYNEIVGKLNDRITAEIKSLPGDHSWTLLTEDYEEMDELWLSQFHPVGAN